MNWEEIVEDLGPRLYRYFCFRFDDIEADDLTQETLIRLVRKVDEGKFDPAKGNLRMLGFGIAHYIALENKPTPTTENIEDFLNLISDENTPENFALTNNSIEHVKSKLKFLTAVEQQIMALTIDQEMTSAEISMILQMPEGTVKSHLFRAKKKLLNLINKEVLI